MWVYTKTPPKAVRLATLLPPAKQVPRLIDDLLHWLATTDHHPLITSSVLSLRTRIHPPLLPTATDAWAASGKPSSLASGTTFFIYCPSKSLIKDQQDRYYQALEQADARADSTPFILFMLDIIDTTLRQNMAASTQASAPSQIPLPTENVPGDQVSDQADQSKRSMLKQLLTVMDDQYWSAKDLMACLALTRKPTFRKHYLNPALQAGLVVMKYPDSPRSPKQKYKKALL